MPIALDPKQTFDFSFATDREKPESERPTLVFHFATCRETAQIAEAFEAADHVKTVAESVAMRCDAMRLILAGWRNFTDRCGRAVPYDSAKLETIVSDVDLADLNLNLFRKMSTAEIAKKKSAYSSQSSLGSSAGTATSAATAA